MPPILQRARFAASALFFLHGLIVSSWLSRIPTVQDNLRLNPGQLGLALLGAAAGALISMPVTGALVSRWGSRIITIGSTILLALALFPLSFAPNRWILTAALVGFGICAGAMNVAMNAQAVFLEQTYARPIMSSFHALFSLGGMSGASIGGVAAAHGLTLLRHFEIAVPFFLIATLVCGPLLLGADRGLPGQPVFARITAPLIGLGCLAFAILLNEGAMADWSSVYLRRSLRTSDAIAAAGYATFSFAMAGGRLLGDWLTLRVGRVALVRYGALVSAVGLAAGLAIGTLPATLAAFLAVGFGFAAIVPLAFGAAGRSAHTPGAGLAAVNTAGYLGFLSGPPVIGFTANAVGLRSALVIVVVLSLIVSALARVVGVADAAI